MHILSLEGQNTRWYAGQTGQRYTSFLRVPEFRPQDFCRESVRKAPRIDANERNGDRGCEVRHKVHNTCTTQQRSCVSEYVGLCVCVSVSARALRRRWGPQRGRNPAP